jgi:dihydrofolate reductase
MNLAASQGLTRSRDILAAIRKFVFWRSDVPNFSKKLIENRGHPQIGQNQIGLEGSVVRKVNVIEFVSLDGVIQAPGGPEEDTAGGFACGGWIIPHSDTVSSTATRKEMNMPFDLLLGRNTFDIWARFWPQQNDLWPAVNTAVKYVASNTMTSHKWKPTVFLHGDIAEKITKIKRQEGPDLHVYGSANLVQTLLKHNLVDALWLKIFPITLGGGKRLFADGTIPAAFNVTESTVTSKGVIMVNYERKSINTRAVLGI